MNKPKEIWSDRYGKDAREGLQVWLSKNVKNYKRNNLRKYIVDFVEYLTKKNSKNTTSKKLVDITSKNFNEFINFIKNNYKHENS